MGCRVDRKGNSDVKWRLSSFISMTVFCKECFEEGGVRKHLAFWSSFYNLSM